MSSSVRKRLLAFTSLTAALGLSACFDVDVKINGKEGVPLSELDTSGASPVELVLAASDNLVLTEGDTLSIDVEGSDEAVAAVRFVIDGDVLGVTREDDLWDENDQATIRITMPAPRDVVITGSGNIQAQGLADNAEVSILGSGNYTGGDTEVSSLDVNVAGSGSAKFGAVTTERLEVNLGGSGGVSATGTADNLDLTIAGSGSADFSGLKADDAEISIAGSGSANLQSDGAVEANIMGSGSVKVDGSAKCTENAMGSGSLRCSG
jgi:Putative auto-transporter adhesin, head GIN domain